MIDDEEPDLSAVIVEAHLAGCPACCDWKERAHAFLRASRIGSRGPAPGSAPGWLAVLVSRAPSRFRSAGALLRGLVVLIALTMLVLTVPLFTADPADTARDTGAFEAALAVTFLLVAWRPQRAAGVAVVAGLAGALLVALEAGALANGGGSLVDLGRHPGDPDRAGAGHRRGRGDLDRRAGSRRYIHRLRCRPQFRTVARPARRRLLAGQDHHRRRRCFPSDDLRSPGACGCATHM